MTRKMLTASIAIVALLFSVLALTADATPAGTRPADMKECDYDRYNAFQAAGIKICADAIDYTGPFTVAPGPVTGPYGWGNLNIVAAAPDAGVAPEPITHGGTGGGGLAHTGNESTVLGYVGTGLIAFGAVALGSRRKISQGALD